jgi:urease accessory protein
MTISTRILPDMGIELAAGCSRLPVLLRLLQTTSSSFPTGAFNHSYGFETWVHEDAIRDAGTAEQLSRDWLQYSVAPCDAAASVLAYRKALSGDLSSLAELDRLVGALKLSREAREGSSKTGRALLVALREIFGHRSAATYGDMVGGGLCPGHNSVVFGIAACEIGITERETAAAFLWSSFSNLVSVVARLVPLGQVETQRIIARAIPLIETCAEIARTVPETELASSMTTLDVAAMQHERLHTRLCMS